MNNLYTYVASKNGEHTQLRLDREESLDKSYIEQDVVVNCFESKCYFSNGVVLKYCNESDLLEENSQVCPECWISYEVISQPQGMNILPKKKTFINHCQEAFWLKMNKQQFVRDD